MIAQISTPCKSEKVRKKPTLANERVWREISRLDMLHEVLFLANMALIHMFFDGLTLYRVKLAYA
jgi:hypothetical protein